MYILAAIAIIGGVTWAMIGWRDSRPMERYMRFALASFALFGSTTALLWIFFPGLTTQMVSSGGGSEMMHRVVQGRGMITVVFAGIAVAALRAGPTSRLYAMLGPFIYNVMMAVEALRAQFTPLATPERWLYVALHGFWALSFAYYAAGLHFRFRVSDWPRLTALGFAIYGVIIGAFLYAAPEAIIPAGGDARDTILYHSSHGFGASLVALGIVSACLALVSPRDARLCAAAVAMANALLIILALATGFPLFALIHAAFALSGLYLLQAGKGAKWIEDEPVTAIDR